MVRLLIRETTQYQFFLREEDKIIYGIVPKTNFYPDILIGYGDELGMQPNMYQIVLEMSLFYIISKTLNNTMIVYLQGT